MVETRMLAIWNRIFYDFTGLELVFELCPAEEEKTPDNMFLTFYTKQASKYIPTISFDSTFLYF